MATRIPDQASRIRKAPRQARARATIEAILDATARILGERGWAKLTTNAVAEVAGVSIGSLYQYFPNKAALIEAVRHRHLEDVLAVLQAAADETRAHGDRIAALVDGMIAVHSRYPSAHRVLLDSPRAGDARHKQDAIDLVLREAYEAVVRVNVKRDTDLSIAAQVLAGALAGAVHGAAQARLLGSLAFRLEMVALIGAHLTESR